MMPRLLLAIALATVGFLSITTPAQAITHCDMLVTQGYGGYRYCVEANTGGVTVDATVCVAPIVFCVRT